MNELARDVTLTVEDLFDLPPDEDRWELVEGQLVREPVPGYEHGETAVALGARLYDFVREHRLGRVFDVTGYVLASDPDTLRGPDLSFLSTERLSTLPRRRSFFVGAPDLAVEVLSPGSTRWEIEVKVEEYLAAGSRAVWVVDPRRKAVVVHLPGLEPVTLEANEILDGGEYLPGFRLPVAEVFEP